MREILFRGKRKDTGEWIEGNLVHQTEYYGDPVDRYHILECREFDGDYYNSAEVIPETVGQFTGLTDKKGTKIFEGDLIKYAVYGESPIAGRPNHRQITYRVGPVIYSDQCFLPLTYAVPNLTVVIGNVHDDPVRAKYIELHMEETT